jgi:hypothetical protein
MTRIALAAAVFVAALPLTAAAQSADETTQPPPPNQGPMTVERMHSGFSFAPEVKITDFDHQTSGLVGGSAGWTAEETFFFGGAGYWMPNGSNGRELGYGGFVMQWFVVGGDRHGISAKVLLGGGGATVLQTVTQVVPLPGPRDLERLTPAQINDLNRARTVTSTVRVHDHFFVAEPEVNGHIALAKHVRLTLGAGYRFAGNGYYYYGGFNNRDRISGAVGTLGVQIGG